MARILTGIQSSGKPHLGNILGAIIPAIEMSKDSKNESLFFIADLHSLTSVRDPKLLKENTKAVAAAWLAFGFDTDKNIFYRQSEIPEVTELAWYLGCITPFPMLANAHSFKDKSEKLSDVNAGLFTYPILMACDIILYSADYVPVGKDQVQHLEMARDIAEKFNLVYGDTFTIPQAKIADAVMTVPGVDGQKMSKSYGNTIDIFQDDKDLLKNIKLIVTDSTPLEEPKNPDTCNVFKIYSLVATKAEIEQMRTQYLAGGFGFGHAKQALFECITKKYKLEREKFAYFFNNDAEIELKLNYGAKKAKAIALPKLAEVRKKMGL
ncbi:MAG: tryptophan--tRNA ligase [Cytophagales bacterium]